MLQTILDLCATAFLLFGVFFMAVGVVGLARFPDLYHRMHASTKAVTLGIMSMLIALAFVLATHPEGNPVNIITKVALVIVFQFVGNPVGAHMLSKAAKLDGARAWNQTIADEEHHPHKG